MAKLTRRVIEDYPVSRALLGGATFVYRGRVYSRNIPLFHDPGGVQALKTGFTRAAGYNLAVAAWRAQERFVLIVLGAHSRSLSYRDARALLAYGFQETGLRCRRSQKSAAPTPRVDAARPQPPAARSLRAGPIRGAAKAYVFDAYGTLFDVHSVIEAGRSITTDPRALHAVAAEAARVHVATIAHGTLRGFLGGDRARCDSRSCVSACSDGAQDHDADGRLLTLACFPEVRGALERLAGGRSASLQRRATDARRGVRANGLHDPGTCSRSTR